MDLKNSWRKRAKALNERPMKGEFEQSSRELGRTTSELKETLRVEMKREWKRLVKQLHHSLKTMPSSKLSEKVCKIGNEKIKIGSHSFR